MGELDETYMLGRPLIRSGGSPSPKKKDLETGFEVDIRIGMGGGADKGLSSINPPRR